jgi:hypothetical protein
MAATLFSCRGKEGPQGPAGPQGPQGNPGQDLTRPQDGFIEGTARGKDNAGNNFNIPFRYTYYFGLGTYRTASANTLEIIFDRFDSLGVGSLSFSFQWNQSNNNVSSLSIDGVAANIAQSPAPTYNVETLPSIGTFFAGTTQTISNLSLSGDTLQGRFQYIRPTYNNVPGIGTNTHPDTVSGTFKVRLIRTQRFNRETR